MVSKIKLWWYDQIIHRSLEKFANGNLKLQPFADTVQSFFCAMSTEGELSGTKYDQSYGKRMIWSFVTCVIPALTNEASSIKDIGDALKQGLRFLDDALLSRFGGDEDNAEDIIADMKSLKAETVLLAIVKFLSDKSESRIIYNRNKDCLSRFQKDGIKCVLQELLDPKKVLVPYAQYFKLIQELVHKVVSTSSPTLISKIAQICSERSKDGDGIDKLVDDIDCPGEENKSPESGSERNSSSLGEISVSVADGEITNRKSGLTTHRESTNDDDDVDILEASPTPYKKEPCNSRKAESNHEKHRSRRPPSVTIGLFKQPSTVKSRPSASEGAKQKAGSVTSSRTSYSSRQKRQFTPLQDAYIIMGMKKFGTHKREWKKILQNYPFPEYRTPVHLKDRWRTLLNQGQVKLNHGELKLGDKYASLIKYLSTKKMPEKDSGEKNNKTPKKRQKLGKEDNPETPDLSYLTPEDLSDPEDQESIPLPGLEHVRRWIKTGTAVTDKKPQSRIPPLLTMKKNDQDRIGGISRATSGAPNSDCKKADPDVSQKMNFDKTGVNKMSYIGGEGTGVDPTTYAGTSRKQETLLNHVNNRDDASQSEKTDSPSPQLISSYKEYEYEKNSNGKYIRKQRKAEKPSGSKQTFNKNDDLMSNVDDEMNNLSETKQIKEASNVELQYKDSASDKTLLPPEDDKEDVDLISEMEKENSMQPQQSSVEQEEPQSTLDMLQNIDNESNSQADSQSSSNTEKSFVTVSQKSSTTTRHSQDSLKQVQQESQSTLELLQGIESQEKSADSPGFAHSLERSASDEENLGSIPQIDFQPAQSLSNHKVQETSAVLSADETSGMLKFPKSADESSQDSKSSVTCSGVQLNMELAEDGESDNDSLRLVIDEGPSDTDMNETLVNEHELERRIEKWNENPSVEDHTSDGGGYTTAQEKEGNPTATAANGKHPSELNGKRSTNPEVASPACSHGHLSNLNPQSPISEYYTASEGSHSENDQLMLHSSDAEEHDENNTTVMQNATLKDDDIPNNIEQWIAENPPSSSLEIQENTRDLLSRLSMEKEKSSQESDLGIDHAQVKMEPAGSQSDSSTDSETLLDTFQNPGPEQPSVPDAGQDSHEGLKREFVTSDDVLGPPQPTITNMKEYKLFTFNKTPTLRLERIKIEPGVFTTNFFTHMGKASDNEVDQLTPVKEVQQRPADRRSSGDSETLSNKAAFSVVDVQVNEACPLDLTVKRKRYLAIKSTSGTLNVGRPRLSVKTTSGLKRLKSQKKTIGTKRKSKTSSRSDENLTDVTTGSSSDAASKSRRKKPATLSKKRKIVLHDEGVSLKLSRDDALLFDSLPGESMSKEFETFGKPKQGRRKAWSQEEDDNLVAGVQRFGEGRWKSILDSYQFKNRTVVNLKDRYRILKEN